MHPSRGSGGFLKSMSLGRDRVIGVVRAFGFVFLVLRRQPVLVLEWTSMSERIFDDEKLDV